MKRIVVCADGTWNERDRVDEKTGRRHPTNVTKVARAVLPQAANGFLPGRSDLATEAGALVRVLDAG